MTLSMQLLPRVRLADAVAPDGGGVTKRKWGG